MIPQGILFPSIGPCATANLIFCDVFHQTHGYFSVSLGQYLEFWGKLFYATLCAFHEVCFVLVPQSAMCYTSEPGGDLVIHHFDSPITTTLILIINSFEQCFVHIGLCDTTRDSILTHWNMCYS
jgi:hypothetical protein